MMDERRDAGVSADHEKDQGNGTECPEKPLLVWTPSHKVDEYDPKAIQCVVDHGAQQKELTKLEERSVVLRDEVIVRGRVGHRFQPPNMQNEVCDESQSGKAVQHPGKHARADAVAGDRF